MHHPPTSFHHFRYLNTVLSPCAPISLHTHTERHPDLREDKVMGSDKSRRGHSGVI